MSDVTLEDLHRWCSIPAEELAEHKERRVPLRLVRDSAEMGQVMAAAGIDVQWIGRHSERPTMTSVCMQYPDGGGANVTARDSAAACLSMGDIVRCRLLLERQGAAPIVMAVPEVPLPARDHLLALATDYAALRVASFTSSEIEPARGTGMFSRVDLVALNEEEAAVLVRGPLSHVRPGPFLRSCARTLRAHQPHIRIVVSAGRHGAYASAVSEWVHIPALPVEVVSTAGAGDALLAGIIAALAAGMPFLPLAGSGTRRQITSALDLGILLAAYSVTSPHTIHPGADLASLLSFARRVDIDIPASTTQYFTTPGIDPTFAGAWSQPATGNLADEARARPVDTRLERCP
jgi:sugar/nucleoside kinase (ribokinase family)